MSTRRGPYAKSAERRAAIVSAASDVFAANGYRGGSLQQVADAVGMSQTSLLYYFPTKGDLLLAVLERRDEVSAERVAAVVDPDDLVERVVAQAAGNAAVPGLVALYAVLAGEAVTEGNPGREHVTARFARLRHEFADELRRLAARGRLREGVDPERAAAGLVALWDGLQLQWLLDPGAVDVAEGLRAHLDLLVVAGPPASSDPSPSAPSPSAPSPSEPSPRSPSPQSPSPEGTKR